MKLPADAPIGTVVLHPHGAGVVRLNDSIEQQGPDCMPGAPHRLVAVQFSGSSEWQYFLPEQEFIDVIRSSAHDVATA